jgi:acyl-CoA thioester hydrolase
MTTPATPILLTVWRGSVRFRDCDSLGHVNNAVYLTYLEQARFSLWRAQLDFTANGTRSPRGEGFILARVECDFRSQARYGDQLDVRLSLTGLGRTSFAYGYEIVDVPTGRLVAEATTVQVRYDYDLQKPVPISSELRTRLSLPVTSTV